ncbi:uncharacterized protein RJT21DRAFT_122205 [Scheffersomyces amazonensis]|uniref:uncharacterized protein n=1 Tax=Scheffersomyces amazonensis TaxID=1078765 RepID=UPI00315D3D26
MKSLKLLLTLLATSTTIVISDTSTTNSITDYFSSWSVEDIKEFLKDRNIAVPLLENDKKEDDTYYTQLKELANDQYETLKSQYDSIVDKVTDYSNAKQADAEKQKVLNWDWNLEDSVPEQIKNYGYLFKSSDDKQEDSFVKDWIFESWPIRNLIYFSYNNKLIDSLDYSTKNSISEEFIDTIKQKYDDIVKTKNLPSRYPGDWLYELWSLEDLQEWLKKYEIPFNEESDTRRDLLKKVKEYSYLVSQSIRDSKDSLYESLNLGTLDDYAKYSNKKVNQYSDEFWKLWSYSQLREWLYYNGIIDKSPSVYDESLTRDKLLKLMKSKQNYLRIDLEKYLDKIKGQVPKDIDIKDDTFLQRINKWSKDRLRKFLEIRGIKTSSLTPKKDLITYVKVNRDKPVIDDSFSWLYDTFSTESIINWLKEEGASVDGTRKDLLKSFESTISDTFQSSKQRVQNAKENLPSLAQYQEYLKKKYPNKKFNQKSIDATYELVSSYYDTASNSVLDGFQDTRVSLDDTWKTLQGQAFDYAGEVISTQKNIKNIVADQYTAAKEKAQSSSEAIAAALTKKYRASKLKQYFNKLTQHFQNEKDNLSTLVKSNQKETPGFFTSAYNYILGITDSAKEKVHKKVNYGKKQSEFPVSQYKYIINSFSVNDLSSYLQNFGYDVSWLVKLSKDQLVRLANEQTDIFFSSSKDTSIWDKSIVEILQETSDSIQEQIGLKPTKKKGWFS